MKRILSLVGLVLALVGMPFVLNVLVGAPHMPHVDLSEVKQTLSGPFLSVDSVIRGLGLVTWVLWAYLFIVASLRVTAIIFVQRGSPTGKALMSVTSRMAPSLLLKLVDVAVGSILVLGPISMAGAVVPDAAVSPMRASGSVQAVMQDRGALNGRDNPQVSRSYLVRPGDSLWRIAERELGSGNSWQAIYALNQGRHFPDGRVFDNPRLIRPNWVLWLPGAPEQTSAPPVQSPPALIEAAPSVNGHAAPPDQARLSVAPKAPTSGEQHVEPSHDPIVNLPSGAGLAASFASGILASQAVAVLRRRRRYLPRSPKVDTSEPDLVIDLRRARLSPETDHLESAGAELAVIWKEQSGRRPSIICAIEHKDRATFLIDDVGETDLKSTSRVVFTRLETCVRAEVIKPFAPSLDRPSALQEGLLIPIGSTRSGAAVHTGLLAAGAVAMTGPDADRLMMQSVLACAVGRTPDDVEIYLLGVPERFGRCAELPHVKRTSSWEDADTILREIELEILRRSRVFVDGEISDGWERLALDLDEFGPAVLVVAIDPPDALTGVLDGIAAQTSNNGCAFLASGWHPSVARIEISVGATIEVTSDVPIASESLRPTMLDDGAVEEVIEIILAAHPRNIELPEIQTFYEVESIGEIAEPSISTELEPVSALMEQAHDTSDDEEIEVVEASVELPDEEVHPVTATRLMDRIGTRDERQVGAAVEVRCLGSFLVSRPESLVLNGWKARSKELLAYLVAHPDGVSKDRIIDTFWRDVKKKSGDHLLRDAIYHLRKHVSGEGDYKWSEGYVTRAGDLIALEPGHWWTDSWTFESLVNGIQEGDDKASIATLRRALDLYRGDFCDDTYYSWSEPIRERYRRLFLDATVKLADLLEVQGEAASAVQVLDRGIEVDPLCEELYRRAIKIEASIGRTNAARIRFQKLTTVLADELGEDPDPQTQELMKGFRKSDRHSEPVASQPRRVLEGSHTRNRAD